MPAFKDEARKTWYVSFYYTDWTGERKRKLKRGFKKKQEALEFERDFLQKEAMSSDIAFKNLVENYFDDISTRIRITTLENKKYVINLKILPYFEKLPINTIKATHIRKWQNELLKADYKPTYIKSINNQLTAIFNYAVKYYGLHVNPCHLAGSIGKKHAEAMEIWTTEEYNNFLKFVDKKAAKLAFEILFWTGIRIGELLALTPSDILDDKKISISKTYERFKGEDLISPPKTPKSKRVIPIPDFLYEHTQEYINSLYDIKKDERIFYFTKNFLEKEIKRCCGNSGVKVIRIHDLRHSHASLLIELGYNILVISERLGHEKVDTTWNTYSHLYPNKQIQLANELNNFRNGLKSE